MLNIRNATRWENTEQDVHMIRMTETSRELEPQLSVQLLSQPEPERRLQPPPPTEDPSAPHLETQLQPELQLAESDPEQQSQAKPAWLNHRTALLLLLGFSLCAATLGLIYYMHHNQQSRPWEGAATPCLSPACQKASAHLATFADPFTRPCDYFLFPCGTDQDHKVAHPARTQQNKEKNTRGLRKEKILDRKTVLLQHLREILESKEGLGSTAAQKARVFYHSCLDTKSIDSAGAEPFLTLIQKLGVWAISDQWKQTDFDPTLRMLMRDYATFPFFRVFVGKDPNETTQGTPRRYIQIDQPELLIPTEWNSKTQKSQARTQTLRPFLASCQRYLALLGAPPSTSMMHVGTFISLSSELAVAATPLEYRLSKGQLYQRMTIRELQSHAPAIDWLGCLRAAFHPMPLTEDDQVLLHNLAYLMQMSRIIDKWLNKHELRNSGPLRTYMVFYLLHTLMPALDSRFSETANSLSSALGNTEEEAPRWKHCVLETERGFDLVFKDLLYERTAHAKMEEMIQNIFSSFKSKFNELKWKDRESFHLLLKKVQALIPRIWTPKEKYSKAELDQLFSKVSVSPDSFFSNYVQILSLWQNKHRQLLPEPPETIDVLSVSPVLWGDELFFPMGMFLPPLFHSTYPRAMNYGVIGFLIAKDILHLVLPDIPSQNETVNAVGECVWAHYLTVTEEAGRGRVHSLSAAQQQELWVQYSALQIALQSYHQSLKKDPSDTSISGLSHTRLFLTSFSQVNCDSDPHREFMPLEPSFLITVLCARSDLCPTSLQCPSKTQQPVLQMC